MSSPIAIGATAVVVAPVNFKRAIIRFQNVGNKVIYIKKIPLGAASVPVSDTDYQVKLHADPGNSGKGDYFDTNSVNGFMAVSANPGSELAVYHSHFETTCF